MNSPAAESRACTPGAAPYFAPVLGKYFKSGWAFFIPYLLAYLLYAWRGWPANPAATTGAIPSLLHVYWLLHGLHLVLGVIAWMQTRRSQPGGAGSVPWLPWVLLALLFLIPGLYLEWPSDPWEHLRRIRDWDGLASVGTHTAGYKSFYFLIYSFVGQLPILLQIRFLNVYVALVSLLLLWQYYRLGRAVGLDERWALFFVLLNALSFGNSCFSFYRYYGLASTMFSQLAAIALIRLAIEFSATAVNWETLRWRQPVAWRQVAGIATSVALLLLLIVHNHIQGLGIAALGIGSVIVARLLQARPRRIWVLLALAAGLSVATVLWWPRHPLVDSVDRRYGWLSAWYGFNLLVPSPASERAGQVLGILGLCEIALAVVLAQRRHLAGWLVLGPVIALLLPLFALPLASRLAEKSPADIVTFHRMLFAIPNGLALAFCCREWLARRTEVRAAGIRAALPFAGLLAALTALVVLSPDGAKNRWWNFASTTPAALEFQPTLATAEKLAPAARLQPAALVATDVTRNLFSTAAPRVFEFRERPLQLPPSTAIEQELKSSWSLHPTRDGSPLNRDPAAASPSEWRTVGGSPARFARLAGGVLDPAATAIQNPPGLTSEIMTARAIPLVPGAAYRVEMSIRQHGGAGAVGRLAVSWYDEQDRLLPSLSAAPIGAGNPAGWENGTYSYFGLFTARQADAWVIHRFSFGENQPAAVPAQARFMRIGALLNTSATAGATIEVANLRVWRESPDENTLDGAFNLGERRLLAVPAPRPVLSFAGLLSGHWNPQQMAVNLAGTPELAALGRDPSARPAGAAGFVWLSAGEPAQN